MAADTAGDTAGNSTATGGGGGPLLADVRVLDLTDHRGEIGPWLLGWLGAEVIRVEPPDGSPARRCQPLREDGPEDLRSLQFAAYNEGKRSVALDLGSADGRSTLLDLLAGAEIVIESGPPGALAEAGIGEADLLAANARLVHVLVTPFGADGPRARQPASELTLAALGGPMSLQGVPERAPVKVSVPQAWRHAGTEAAVAALLGLRRAEQTGEAQWIDVSAQEAMTWTMLNAMEADEIQGHDFERTGLCVVLATRLQLGHRTKDGLSCQVPIGVTCGPIMPWLVEEGIAPAAWIDQDWKTYDHRGLSGEEIVPTFAELSDAVDELCSRHTRRELMEKGLEYGATFAPVNTVEDLLALEHLEHRGFWDHRSDPPSGAELRHPGAPFVIDGERPAGAARAAGAPHLDEAGAELRARPRRAVRSPTARPGTDPFPLTGITVADFSWVGVGPITCRCLADHGATVIRVESEHRLDTTRAQPPFKDGEFGLNRSNFYGSFNASKRSITLNLACEEGRTIARRLATWADVVVDAFRPGTMGRLGLGPEQIHAANPRSITVTTSLLGEGGPLSPLAGYGFHAGAIAGFTDLVGWPDRDPDGPWMAYTDTIGPRFLITAVLAALDRRDRTGAGCHIEGAQLEMGLQYLAPELLDHQLSGRVPRRLGNRDPHLAPQGAYRCAGEDEWCALTITDDETWARFVAAIGAPAWAAAPRYATVSGRRADHDAIDAGIEAWTVDRPAEEVEAMLLAAGVPAGKVQRTRDLRVDPQYVHRRFYRRLEHPEVGVIPYAGHQFRFRGYDNGPRSAAPMFGEHTFEVLTELLGMTSDEVGDAAAAGALE